MEHLFCFCFSYCGRLYIKNEVFCRLKLETPNIQYYFIFLWCPFPPQDRKQSCPLFAIGQSAQTSRKLVQNVQLPVSTLCVRVWLRYEKDPRETWRRKEIDMYLMDVIVEAAYHTLHPILRWGERCFKMYPKFSENLTEHGTCLYDFPVTCYAPSMQIQDSPFFSCLVVKFYFLTFYSSIKYQVSSSVKLFIHL